MPLVPSFGTLTPPKPTTGGAAPTGSVGGARTVLPGEAGELGVTELMIWLTSTMKKTDASIRSQMNDVDKSKEQNEAIGRAIAMMRDLETRKVEGGNLEAGGTTLGALAVSGEWKKTDWYAALPSEIRTIVDDMMTGIPHGGDTIASAEKVVAVRQSLSDLVTTNSSSNEMRMIRLQGEISARGQAFQLISNMMASINDMLKTPIGHIAR